MLQLRRLDKPLVLKRVLEGGGDAVGERADRRQLVLPEAGAGVRRRVGAAAAGELQHGEHATVGREDRHVEDGAVGARRLEVDLGVVPRLVARARHDLGHAVRRRAPDEAGADRPAHLHARVGQRPELAVVVVEHEEGGVAAQGAAGS